MQLIFTQDVPRGNGDAWSKGQVLDYPKATWEQIAKSLGKKLSAFTRTVSEAAQMSVASKANSKAKK